MAVVIQGRVVLTLVALIATTAGCGASQFDDADAFVDAYGFDQPADFPPEMTDYKDVIAGSALPFAVAEGRVGETTVFDSKFLGIPYMPKGFDYPEDPSGRPLSFLVQVNFADVPPLPDYPDSGIVQFYVSNDEDYGKHVWGLQFHKGNPYDPQAQFDLQQSQDYFRVVWHDQIAKDVGGRTSARGTSPVCCMCGTAIRTGGRGFI